MHVVWLTLQHVFCFPDDSLVGSTVKKEMFLSSGKLAEIGNLEYYQQICEIVAS